PADQLAVVVGRGAGDVGDADALLRRTLRRYLPVLDLEGARVDLELLGRDVEDALAHALGREAYGVAADECPTRREGARADGRGVGVRVVHRHPVVWDAERVGDDLRVHG